VRKRFSGFGDDTFSSLKVRNFRLFFGGQLISQTGTWLTMIAQTLLVLKLSDSGIALGILTACQFLPVLLLGAWAGAVADRADKRKLLITVQTLAMFQSVALAITVFSGHATVGAIYVLAACQGVLTAFDNPTRRSFVVEMVPPAEVTNAVSLNSAIMTGSRVVGPAAAGVLVITVGFGWAFLLDAISYLAVLAGLFMMRPSELYSVPRTPKAKGQVREGLRYIRERRELLVPLVMMAIIGTFAFNFSVTIPLLVTRTLHGSDGTFTVLFSVLSLGSLIGALWTARRDEVTNRQLVGASAAFGLSMIALSAAPSLLFAFPAGILVGLSSIAFMTSSTAIVQVRAAPNYRGRVLAIQSMVFLGSTPIGGPIVGWVADLAGPRTALVLGAVGCLVAAAYGAKALGVSGRRSPVDRRGVEAAVLEDEAVALAD
jgi:MFS family permease